MITRREFLSLLRAGATGAGGIILGQKIATPSESETQSIQDCHRLITPPENRVEEYIPHTIPSFNSATEFSGYEMWGLEVKVGGYLSINSKTHCQQQSKHKPINVQLRGSKEEYGRSEFLVAATPHLPLRVSDTGIEIDTESMSRRLLQNAGILEMILRTPVLSPEDRRILDRLKNHMVYAIKTDSPRKISIGTPYGLVVMDERGERDDWFEPLVKMLPKNDLCLQLGSSPPYEGCPRITALGKNYAGSLVLDAIIFGDTKPVR